MDIQFVLDVYACAIELLRQACAEARKGNSSIKLQVRDIGNKFLNMGKSHLVKCLYQAALKYYNSRAGEDFNDVKILLLAPTGKAAFGIQGNTIHSTLAIPASQSLKIYKPLDSSRLNTLKCKLRAVKLICLDEISMLEPVMDGYVFKDMNNSEYRALAPNLWQELSTMFELEEIMRKRESKEFAQLLNRLREGNHTPEDIAKLKERCISENCTNYPIDVPHLFLQNSKVDEFNRRVHMA
ncbi:unnamed protein product, partial [Pocillopora meandrina]